MGSFTTQICDRCKAHFPLKPNQGGDRPVHRISIELYQGSKTETELCGACRAELSTLFYTTFMKGKE